MNPSHIAPRPLIGSTYRFQFHKDFTLGNVIRLVPYLQKLGITTCYASPLLKARKGSTHGYDVVDPTVLNPEIGTEDQFNAFVAELRRNKMSLVLDIVPNHMGVGTDETPWWNDVLKHGRAAEHADYFDIDWTARGNAALKDKVFLPVLGSSADEAIDKGQLALATEGGEISLRYGDRNFPLSPDTSEEASKAVSLGESERKAATRALLAEQNYVLAFWRRAAGELNYRRFFDINDLAGVKMERRDVFDAAHAWILDHVRRGDVAGLRIDHPDGLYNPLQYFQWLRKEAGEQTYIIVEKILALDEPLPTEWPVHGTTGYDFLAMVNALFVDTERADAMTEIYNKWTSDFEPFASRARKSKRLVLKNAFAGELSNLATKLRLIVARDPGGAKIAADAFETVLREVIACFPVYRTYVTVDGASTVDQARIDAAIAAAVAESPELDRSAIAWLRKTLLLTQPAAVTVQEQADFAARFQQLTSPVTAKGIEDTLFYNYNRLISLNEVGGDPARFGVATEALHAYLVDRQINWPYAMSAGSTHDTKRSEDVRARISVLSEIPALMESHFARWRSLNAAHRSLTDGHASPTANEEFLIYQTLIGAWPDQPMTDPDRESFATRIKAYLTKAMREAKVKTTWTEPNAEHEAAVHRFVDRVLDPGQSREFLSSFAGFQKPIAFFGKINCLSQTVIRLTAPGIPDIYQGTELWDLSLVDPDNRRPVDYAQRDAALAGLLSQTTPSCSQDMLDTGGLKMHVIRTLLNARSNHSAVFAIGSYTPIEFNGEFSRHLFGFARQHEATTVIVMVSRFLFSLYDGGGNWPLNQGIWSKTQAKCELLPTRTSFKNLLTGELVSVSADGTLSVSSIMSLLPFAVLMIDGAPA